MYTICPAVWTLRYFALQAYRLFAAEQSPHQALCRRAALVKTAPFQPIRTWRAPWPCCRRRSSRR
jgi:hypothetical protein